MTDNEIIELVMKEFEGFAKCPRPSYHEKKISDHLVKRLKELGVTDVKQDKANNVIANVPATEGYEDVPLTLLQGHMDMVCVAKKGVPFDPETSEIKLVREGNILRADGTSLGADDGAGLATALVLLEMKVAHGPLRIIFTTDEETSMTGARNLDPKYIKDVHYIINCDSEDINIICTGSAGSCHTAFERTVHWEDASGNAAVKISMHGFRGGHSGESIHTGRSNAIQALAYVLSAVKRVSIPFELAHIEGGDASNAIPSSADAVIVINRGDEERIQAVINSEKEKFDNIYEGIETKAEFTMEEAAMPHKVFSENDRDDLLAILTILHSGVFVMNQSIPTLPELSANIGTIKTDREKVVFEYLPRSGNDNRLRALMETLPEIAERTGFSYSHGNQEPAWIYNPDSKLTKMYADAFHKVTGRTARVQAIHGGLETGLFFYLNPKADIISVGPQTHNIHSPLEHVELDSVAELIKSVAETLKEMK